MYTEKPNLHPRNVHRQSYDFASLIACVPELESYVFINDYQTQTINFSIPEAVKLLNKALLKQHYGINFWDIPKENLCPPIPGRADYIHYIADLLSETHNSNSKTNKIKGLDIGVGANLIYPLLATKIYNWQMFGSDISKESLENAQNIIENNKLEESIQLKLQANQDFIFRNIIGKQDRFTFTMCNPPFHDSEESANQGNIRKTKNLKLSKNHTQNLNFGGKQNELWCEGGDFAFITKMIFESVHFSHQVLWFTCLVSKKENLYKLTKLLKKVKTLDFKTVEMAQGQKVSRFIAWTFVPQSQHKDWQS
ncbi:23S rRNA (adenine(1618)-N(6))-methyltransferase RlmF [Chryseobacterium sp.]|uniref:23S rRNA (adenine(1618)-N(6))-methyltransferase RlmF n=1 Tax=Chryseobacterium sp. TaxID=1871047 RepID=UPI00388EBF85